MRSLGRTCWSDSPTSRAAVGAALFLLGLVAASPAAARLRDSRLLVRWNSTPFDGATLTVLSPGGGRVMEQLTSVPEGEVRFVDLVAGRNSLELRDGGGRVLRSWSIFLPADLTTVATLDAGEGTLLVHASHPNPFGNVLTWSESVLSMTPGQGTEGLLAQVLPLSAQGLGLNGGDPGPVTRLRSPGYRLDGDAVGIVVPLGGRPSYRSEGAADVSTDRSGGNSLRLTGSGGSGGEGGGAAHLQLARTTGPLGPIEIEGAFQGRNVTDAGPLGFSVDTGDENDLQALETRWTAFCRPAGQGLARFDFHAAGQSRRHYLQEFRQDTKHAPREDRSTLRGSGAWEFAAGPAEFTLGTAYIRNYSETGDGEAFDRIDNYRIGSIENEDAIDTDNYGLYWRGPSARIAQIPHLFDYYTQDLTSSWSFRVESRARLRADAPLRLGLEWERTTWRWYEHLDPIVDANIPGSEQTGYQFASYLGYSRDASDRDHLPGHDAPRPRRLTAHADQTLRLGPADLEGGVRWSSLSPDQKPLRDRDHPLANDAGLTASDLRAAPTHSFLDPAFGLHLPWGESAHLWADLNRSHAAPPYEMLYYSENVLTQFATQDVGAKHPARYQTFGNPGVEPEATTAMSVSVGRDYAMGGSIRVTARLDRTSDTWVARRHAPADGATDSLAFYENHGNRRERSIRLDLQTRPWTNTTLRGSYTLSSRETDVIEPAPLYRTLLLPDSPVQGTGTLETSPLAPLWFDDGVDRDWFPSLLDQRHRVALTWTSRLGAITEGTAAEALLADLDLTCGFRAASGLPYTPTYLRPEGLMTGTEAQAAPALSPAQPVDGDGNGVIDASELNSERMPWSWQVDLGVQRGLRLFGQSFALALELQNLTNRKNPRLVYGATGKADDDGWLDSAEGRAYLRSLGGGANAYADAYADRIDNPNRYEAGRTAKASLSWQF